MESTAKWNEGKSISKSNNLKIPNKLNRINNLFGICVAIISGILFSRYMQQLHESRLWFSNLELIEQEISLRTECGLYYSYYKNMVNNNNETFLETISQLFIHDITTEYPREINILQRFNIYQEILLAQLYKLFKYYKLFEIFIDDKPITPMLFYVHSCFFMAGFGIFTLFLVVWHLYDSWIYGLLVFVWMCANLEDSTRVFFSVNLRENYSLPFFWLQNLFIIKILNNYDNNNKLNIKLLSSSSLIRSTYQQIIAFTASTFLFALFWQFNQFLLLIQSVSLFVTAILKFELMNQIRNILIAQSFALFCVAFAQFAQPMTLFSISTQFNMAVLIIFSIFESRFNSIFHHFKSSIILSFVKMFVTFLLFILINLCVNFFNTSNSDSHIWTFVKAKLGMHTQSPVPFETALYLCHGAFKFMDWSFFVRTSRDGCLLLYLISLTIIVIYIVYCLLMKEETQQQRHFKNDIIKCHNDHLNITAAVIYLVIQSAQIALIAIFALRMKYVWYPQMIVIAIWVFYSTSQWLTPKCGKILAVSVALALLYRHYDVYKEQINDEQEFYDPDTVELMEWIIKSTPQHSSWAGSMQLMAGVKACTNRFLINHPHFEDAWIRKRTQRVYQIYGRKSLEEVHRILVNESVNYIIIEESICFAKSSGCSTNDIVDLSNGHFIDSIDHPLNSVYASQLTMSQCERFCERIRNTDSETIQFFKLVFINPTFRVYQILLL